MVITKATFEQIEKKNPLAKVIFKRWQGRDRPRDEVSVRRMKEQLKDVNVVCSTKQLLAFFDQADRAGLGFLLGEGPTLRFRFSVPMKTIIGVLNGSILKVPAPDPVEKIVEHATAADRPDIVRMVKAVAKSSAHTRVLNVPLDAQRSVGIDLPKKFTAEDAEFVAQFIRRQASE